MFSSIFGCFFHQFSKSGNSKDIICGRGKYWEEEVSLEVRGQLCRRIECHCSFVDLFKKKVCKQVINGFVRSLHDSPCVQLYWVQCLHGSFGLLQMLQQRSMLMTREPVNLPINSGLSLLQKVHQSDVMYSLVLMFCVWKRHGSAFSAENIVFQCQESMSLEHLLL